ncbi:hypothetical protein ACLOJK_026210 [Asimina triloba]
MKISSSASKESRSGKQRWTGRKHGAVGFGQQRWCLLVDDEGDGRTWVSGVVMGAIAGDNSHGNQQHANGDKAQFVDAEEDNEDNGFTEANKERRQRAVLVFFQWSDDGDPVRSQRDADQNNKVKPLERFDWRTDSRR